MNILCLMVSLAISFFSQSLVGAATLYYPTADRKYNETCWLTSHNSYASKASGYVYANQNLSIDQQLRAGVRAFELDIEERCWGKGLGAFGTSGCTVSMCHGSCLATKFIAPSRGLTTGLLSAGGDPESFVLHGLKPIKNFLNGHERDIVTIMLENRVLDYKILDKTFEDAGMKSIILKPSDWDPVREKGWPTLEWMISNNKRVVIFNGIPASETKYETPLAYVSSKYTYYQWAMMVANMYGQLNMDKAAFERPSSKEYDKNPRYLFELDYFAKGAKIGGDLFTDLVSNVVGVFKGEKLFTSDYNKVNGTDLNQFLHMIVEDGVEGKPEKGRYPNFVKVDFVDQGNPLSIVNQINYLADDPKKREQMFEPFT